MFKILNMVFVKFLLLLFKTLKCWRVMVLRLLYTVVIIYMVVWYKLLAIIWAYIIWSGGVFQCKVLL